MSRNPFAQNFASKMKKTAIVGSAATFAVAGANIVKSSHKTTEEIVNNSSIATTNYEKSVADSIDSLTATVRNNDGSSINYSFVPHEVLSALNNAIDIYKPLAERYKYTRILTSSEKADFEKAIDIILDSNVKFIEIQTQDLKMQISNTLKNDFQQDVKPDRIEITYNDTNQNVSIEIDGTPIKYGPKFEALVTNYKQYILATEFKNWKDAFLSEKIQAADKVIENVCNSVELFETLHNPNSQFQMIEDDRAGSTIKSIEFVAVEKEKDKDKDKDSTQEQIKGPSIQVQKKDDVER